MRVHKYELVIAVLWFILLFAQQTSFWTAVIALLFFVGFCSAARIILFGVQEFLRSFGEPEAQRPKRRR